MVTIWLTWTVIRWVDRQIGVDIPGVGLLVTLLVITAIGALGSSWLARGLIAWIEDVLESLPFIRLLYTSSKDLLNAFVGEKRRFTRSVRVSLTADGGVSVLGFVTAESLGVIGRGRPGRRVPAAVVQLRGAVRPGAAESRHPARHRFLGCHGDDCVGRRIWYRVEVSRGSRWVEERDLNLSVGNALRLLDSLRPASPASA